VPSPNAPGAADFWNPIEDVVQADCGGCHDNDPVMYSPFIGQVWDEIATNSLGNISTSPPKRASVEGADAWASSFPATSRCLHCKAKPKRHGSQFSRAR